jgi:succinate dehydrogenase/fumarate reductase-like Fe-S protein
MLPMGCGDCGLVVNGVQRIFEVVGCLRTERKIFKMAVTTMRPVKSLRAVVLSTSPRVTHWNA